MKTKHAFLISSAALFAAGTALAQEQANAAQLAQAEKKPAAQTITLTIPDIPKIDLKVSAFTQVQYVTSHSSGSNESSKSGFAIRRANIGVSAKIDENWSARVSYEFDSKDSGGSVGSGYIDKALIEYKNDFGTLQVGCRKVDFMLEEYSSALSLPCMESSIATSYIVGDKGPVGLAGRHLGVYWSGKVEDFTYGTSFTNAVANDYDKRSNNYAFSANAGYTLKMQGDAKLLLALNSIFNHGDEGGIGAKTNRGFTYGFEPYAKFTSGAFTAILDCFYVDAESKADLGRTLGANATVAYRLENDFEPVARLSYVNTHNDDLNASAVKNVSASGDHSNAHSYYLGVNYYPNKYVKVSAGGEYMHLYGNGGKDDSASFRVQLQVAF